MEPGRFICPVLRNPELYKPDTIDLINDINARRYWLSSLGNMVMNFVKKAEMLNPDNPTAAQDAEVCYGKFQNMLEKLRNDPGCALKPLSVRKLLEFNEDNLRENNFKDAWLTQKIKESEQALKEFSKRIEEIDSIKDFEQKWLELIKGVLAGNVFDWGSTKVAEILDTTANFGLVQAMMTIQKQPWFVDDFEVFVKQLQEHPYKSVAIFVDNAGYDFILGIIPLVRELLLYGSKVILTANSSPALNDVTYHELNVYCCKAAQYCSVLKNSIANGQLVTVENGQRGPCLDLANISEELTKLLTDVDLIILEGMGRAVHTNFKAKFTIDCLKLAVLKNEWLAENFGTKQFGVVCAFEPAI